METWKPVIGYEDSHEVSNMGNVRGIDRYAPSRWGSFRLIKGKPLKPYLTKPGYTAVQLRNKDKRHFIHRLVANAFLGIRTDSSQVNHINGLKADNRLENLEWCTPSENHFHAAKTGLKPTGTKSPLSSPVQVKDVSTNAITSYGSIREAAFSLGLNYKNLSSNLSRGYMTHKGLEFKYIHKRHGNTGR